VADNRLFNGSKPLTPQFAAIDSFELSLDRKEVVFSAKRKDSFDVGLVSMDGSDIHWIPEDPADEVSAQWAPRGNKVSYILHTPTGSIVRTVHIPTASQVSVNFPQTQIDALAWEPKGERYAVVIESLEASQQLVSMTYEGQKREQIIAPAAKIDVTIEPIAGILVMRPAAMHYNERLPLVVWTAPNPFAWSDARAALIRNARVAIAIAPRIADNFWSEAKSVAWIDSTRTYIVGNPATQQPSNSATLITADPNVPNHRYVRRGNSISVPPAVVQSFAAAFIADDLKGTPPPNGRR
jgi:Tol biopolymer transport system component